MTKDRSFLMDWKQLDEEMRKPGRTSFAVDADGTMLVDDYPNVRFQEHAIRVLLSLQAAGHKLMLWTCREGAERDLVVSEAKRKGLMFDAVNANLEDVVRTRGVDSRKIVATYYLDDRDPRGFMGWLSVEKWAKQKGLL